MPFLKNNQQQLYVLGVKNKLILLSNMNVDLILGYCATYYVVQLNVVVAYLYFILSFKMQFMYVLIAMKKWVQKNLIFAEAINLFLLILIIINTAKFTMINEFLNYLYIDTTIPNSVKEMDLFDLHQLLQNRLQAHKKVDLSLAEIDSPEQKRNYFAERIPRIYKDFGILFAPQQNQNNFLELDRIAHLTLKILFSENDEDIRTYAKYERYLFETRIQELKSIIQQVHQLYKLLGIEIIQLSDDEYNKFRNNLVPEYIYDDNIKKRRTERNEFYKIDFTKVAKSIENLDTFLYKGKAYIHNSQLIGCLMDVFQTKLQESMVNLNRSTQYTEMLEQDDQISYLMTVKKHQQEDVKKYNIEGGLDHQSIHYIAKQSFPLCMRYMFDKLQENHHLKYHGRQEFQLFVKSAGMKLVEALIFFRQSFKPRFSDQDFDKKYSYSIRHNYGEEGKRADYKCHSCSHLINQNPGNDEYHGCAIKILNEELLKRYLQQMQIDVDPILELKRKNHYQVACKKIWESRHINQRSDFVIQNPIDYFSHSIKSANDK